MRSKLMIMLVLAMLWACGSGSESVPPPEKGLLLNPQSDTLPERETVGPDEDDELGRDEIIDEEHQDN